MVMVSFEDQVGFYVILNVSLGKQKSQDLVNCAETQPVILHVKALMQLILH